MNHWTSIAEKVKVLEHAQEFVAAQQQLGKTIVFTNGCFDILHMGHVSYLAKARDCGDCLVVGVNSDESVRRLKGSNRPINPESQRAAVLASLAAVDIVVIFEEETPLNLIQTLRPDVLIKGGDYTKDTIVGATEVEATGGEVMVLPFVDGLSTTHVIKKMQRHVKN